MINTKMGAFLLAAFIAGAFIASPELRAYAANTVFSTDIKDGEVKTPDLANNAVTSAKIKDGEIKTDDIATDAVGSIKISNSAVGASEIAQDAVGASEIAGVSKLIFAECTISNRGPLDHGWVTSKQCSVPGAREGDNVIATLNGGEACFVASWAKPVTNWVHVAVTNACEFDLTLVDLPISIIVYDTAIVKPPLP